MITLHTRTSSPGRVKVNEIVSLEPFLYPGFYGILCGVIELCILTIVLLYTLENSSKNVLAQSRNTMQNTSVSFGEN